MTGTKKCQTLTDRASMIPLVPDQHPGRCPRKRRWVMTKWGPMTLKKLKTQKSLGSLESPLNLTKSCFRAFTPSPRPCRQPTEPPVMKYRQSSGKAW